MNLDDLDYVLEALMLVSGEGLRISDITETLELQRSEIEASLKRLKRRYGGKSGIIIQTYGDKIQFASNPKYAEAVESVLKPVREKELSNAALETVAIIAYRQPVTRLEVEQVRGVNCDYAIQVLLKHDLIEVKGRKDAVGKPLLFGTTEKFLKRFRIEDINQLPDYDRLLESITVIEENSKIEAASLYNEFELPEQEATPEFLEGEKVDKVE
ncbi:MAG: SMC-Scp complex subunit ScpB [Clostridia bacterium]|nr:SMC-Scp complex subunit ScpB [Clostridia bacterium]